MTKDNRPLMLRLFSASSLAWFWKNWNEFVLFLLSLVLFFLVPRAYRSVDPTAGAFDAGLLHVIITGFMLVQFILTSSWLSYKFTFPRLHRWMDDKMEDNTIEVLSKFQVNVFSVVLYFAYVIIHTIIFSRLL